MCTAIRDTSTKLMKLLCCFSMITSLDFLILQWLDEGHFSVGLQAVGVEDMVKFVVIDLHSLAQNGELFKNAV